MRSHVRTRIPRQLRASLALAALCHLIGTVAAATAQTVIVTKAPAGTPVELGLNGAVVASGPIGAEGWVTLDTKWAAQRKPGEETPVTVYVDICEDSRRVMLVEPGQQPLGTRAGCARRAVPGVYVMRAVTTFVVEATDSPSVRLRQGSVPRSWLVPPETRAGRPVQPFGPMPEGLVLFAGGGLTSFSNTTTAACGTVAECSAKGTQPAWTAGATYWLSPVFGAEVSYMQPKMVTATGQSAIQQFGSTREARLLFLGGKVGGSSGRARVYGQAGAIYGWTLTTVSQIVSDRPVDVDGQTVTIVGGTQRFQLETKGWSWGFAGGLEIWIKPRFGIYTEVGRIWLKGKDVGTGEGRIDDRAWSVMIGGRFRLLR